MIELTISLIFILIIFANLIAKIEVGNVRFDYINLELSQYAFKVILILVIASSTILLYLELGCFDKIDKYIFYKINNSKINQILSDIRLVDKAENLLLEQIKENSSNEKLKLLLAKLLTISGKNINAGNILETVEQEDLQLGEIQSYIETKFFLTNKLSKKDIEYADKVLKKRPNIRTILAINATDSFRKKEFFKSLRYQNSLLLLLDKNSIDYKATAKLIKKTNQLLAAHT